MAKTWEWEDDDDEKHQHAMIARLGWRDRRSRLAPSQTLGEFSGAFANIQKEWKSKKGASTVPPPPSLLSLLPESPPGICATLSAGRIGGKRGASRFGLFGTFCTNRLVSPPLLVATSTRGSFLSTHPSAGAAHTASHSNMELVPTDAATTISVQ